MEETTEFKTFRCQKLWKLKSGIEPCLKNSSRWSKWKYGIKMNFPKMYNPWLVAEPYKVKSKMADSKPDLLLEVLNRRKEMTIPKRLVLLFFMCQFD